MTLHALLSHPNARCSRWTWCAGLPTVLHVAGRKAAAPHPSPPTHIHHPSPIFSLTVWRRQHRPKISSRCLLPWPTDNGHFTAANHLVLLMKLSPFGPRLVELLTTSTPLAGATRLLSIRSLLPFRRWAVYDKSLTECPMSLIGIRIDFPLAIGPPSL